MAELLDDNGGFEKDSWCFFSSAVGTMVAAWAGSTPIIVTIESASGIQDGGRTGLTSVVTGCYFLLSLFLEPLLEDFPSVATAPVLIIIGSSMAGNASSILWDQMDEAIPAFITILLMPLTYSITNGMIFGSLATVGFSLTTGKWVQNAKHYLSSRSCRKSTRQGGMASLPLAHASQDKENRDDTSKSSAQYDPRKEFPPTSTLVHVSKDEENRDGTSRSSAQYDPRKELHPTSPMRHIPSPPSARRVDLGLDDLTNTDDFNNNSFVAEEP
jgi:hypothetical protein